MTLQRLAVVVVLKKLIKMEKKDDEQKMAKMESMVKMLCSKKNLMMM